MGGAASGWCRGTAPRPARASPHKENKEQQRQQQLATGRGRRRVPALQSPGVRVEEEEEVVVVVGMEEVKVGG